MANISKAERERRASASAVRAVLEDSEGQTPSSQIDSALVRLKRDPGQFPAPHECDAHPDEVANYRVGGWVVA